MTTNDLAAGYYRKCGDRLAALEVLRARAAFSDVVRESQEVVELALKGMLRWAGIDPPKIRDVGGLLLEFARRFDDVSRQELRPWQMHRRNSARNGSSASPATSTSFRPKNLRGRPRAPPSLQLAVEGQLVEVVGHPGLVGKEPVDGGLVPHRLPP